MANRHIVFIHGLFVNPLSWQPWIEYFTERGYICHAPAYPYHDGKPSTLRAQFDVRLAGITLQNVVDQYVAYIGTLPEKPLLIGHSMGGLVVQKLLAQNLGSVGVCLNSAPPKGVLNFQWSFLKSNFPTVNPLAGNTICIPSVHWFHYAFCHTLTLAQANAEYVRSVVPESRAIPRSTLGAEGVVDFTQPHAPLLFLAGGADHITPPALNKKNCIAYTDTPSVTDFAEFPGRTHYMYAMNGWQEIASTVHQWIVQRNEMQFFE